jgi:eukaryotic-like serine/threonine-protein kinase
METFGRYQLQSRLGQGGMGVVYRAFDTVLERVVALKLVLTPEGLDPEMRERFFREARAAGHLSHKNIVTIYDLGEHEGKPYLAMEFLDGEDLQRRLARPERMSLSHKLRLAIEICEGVEFAHSHGIIHRDIKPANIYITPNGGAKILDFGLARLMTSQLTASNMLMGTLNYMAPEQVRGERADQRSDVFSVGVVLYELFGGRKAFEGDSVASTLFKILQEAPEPLWKIDAGLPRELAVIVERTLAKLPDERYPDMSSLRRDLEDYRELHRAAGPATPTPIPIAVPSIADMTRTAPSAPVPPAVSSSAAPQVNASAVPGSGAVAQPVVHDAATRFPIRGAAIAAAVLLVAVGAGFAVQRFSRPESVSRSAAPLERAEDPIAARLRAAQQALDARQYGAALSAAEVVLLQAPQNAEAQRIRGAARQAALDDALTRGSRHLTKGETSDAIRAAGEALALAPDNAEARHILEQAGARTSGRDADTARRLIMEARGAARSGAAAPQPVSPRPASTPQPAAEQPAAAPPATQPAPTPTPTPAPSVVAPPAPVIPPVTTPAAAAPPPAAPAPAPEAAQPPAAEERINELIGRYKEALESRSFEQLQRLWPSLSGAAATAMRQEFQHAARIRVELGEPQISVSGASGRVTFVRKYTVVTVEGQSLQSTALVTMDVKRTGSSWVIDTIRFATR